MARIYFWIALFVTIQISVVLCRSTVEPNTEGKGSLLDAIGLAPAGIVEVSNFTADGGNNISIFAAVPNKMSSDVYNSDYYYDKRATESAAAIAAIVIGVFVLCSLILGCIVFFCCKKEPRRGFIINANSGAQFSGIQNPGFRMQPTLATTLPIQQYPPTSGQQQQQNMYPPTYPTK